MVGWVLWWLEALVRFLLDRVFCGPPLRGAVRQWRSLAAKPLDENRGFVGDMFEIRGEGQSEEDAFILKRSGPLTLQRALVEVAGGAARRECAAAKAFPSVQPEVVDSGVSLGGLSFFHVTRKIVGTPLNKLCGNQCWGGAIATTDAELLTALKAAVSAAAVVHSSPPPADVPLKGRPLVRRVFELSRSAAASRLAAAKRRFSLNPRLVAVLDRCVGDTTFEACAAWLDGQRDRLVPCHGDFHASNTWITRDGRALLVDWAQACWGFGAADVAQMVISDVSPAWWQQHGEEVLQHYHAQLRGRAAALTLAQVREDFALRGFERWVWLFAVVAGWGPDMPEQLVRHFERQMVAFLDQHPLVETSRLYCCHLGLV